jgi:hypothetical protein
MWLSLRAVNHTWHKGTKMWQILKTELDYTKEGLMVGYAIALLFFIAAMMWEDWGISRYMLSTAITYFITIGIIGSEGDKDQRTRYHSALPVTPRQRAVVDLLYITLVQAGMVLLWLSMLIFKSGSAIMPTFWSMFSLNGLLLSLMAIFIIHTHFGFYGTKKYKRIDYAILLLLIIAAITIGYFGYGSATARFLWRHYMSASGALVSTLLWLGLSYLSVIVCVRRKSYLA